MQSNLYNQIIKHIVINHLDQDKHELINFDQIKYIILDKFEDVTGCKLYNKSYLIKDIETIIQTDNTKLMDATIEAINKNLIAEITFTSMFKSNLEFTIVFKDDEIIILYKNKKVELNNLLYVKTDLLNTKLKYMPVITELYVNNILNVIEKLINKDITVKYHLTNFDIPYWNLFEIKCKKSNLDYVKQLEKCKHILAIISGKNYQLTNNCQNEFDPKLTNMLSHIEDSEKNFTNKGDNYHRLEIVTILKNMELEYFVESCEQIDKIESTIQINDNNEINKYIKLLLDISHTSPRPIIKYYMINKLFKFIMKIKHYLINNQHFLDVLTNKINELQDNINSVHNKHSEFTKDLVYTIHTCKKFIQIINSSLPLELTTI